METRILRFIAMKGREREKRGSQEDRKRDILFLLIQFQISAIARTGQAKMTAQEL